MSNYYFMGGDRGEGEGLKCANLLGSFIFFFFFFFRFCHHAEEDLISDG